MAVQEEVETNKFDDIDFDDLSNNQKALRNEELFIIVYIRKEFLPDLLPVD